MAPCVLSRFSRVRLLASPWTVARQAPQSMGFSRQEYWSGLPCLPPGDPPHLGLEPASPWSPALAGRSFTTSVTWEAHMGTIAKRKAGRGLLASPSGKLVIVVHI